MGNSWGILLLAKEDTQMPWKEVEKVELRALFAAAWEAGEKSFKGLCLEFGISRKTGYKWIKRYQEEGRAGLSDRSRRPHRIHYATDESVVARLVAKRRFFPYWGARKLCELLSTQGVEPPRERTANRILKREGLIEPRQKVTAALRRFERSHPNDLWQMDHKKAVHGAWSVRMVPFVVLDDHSRFMVGLRSLPDKGVVSTWEALWGIFGEFGLPLAILSDNDSVFHGRSGPSRLEARLMRLGIDVLHGRVYHPQTQGKVEKVNGTMELEFLKDGYFRDHEELQPGLDVWRDQYNYIRPHEALSMKVPGSIYRPSSRIRPDEVPEMEYGTGVVLRKANKDGWIHFKGRRISVGVGVAGEALEVRETEAGVEVYFGPYRIPGEYMEK
jgi:transposase InsO family protein